MDGLRNPISELALDGLAAPRDVLNKIEMV